MSEINSSQPNLEPSPDRLVLTELPVEVSPERQEEVGMYFDSILDQYGHTADIRVGGKMRVNKWPGEKADFINGNERLVIEKINHQHKGTYTFPEVKARLFQWQEVTQRGKTRKMWQATESFNFDRETKELTFKDGRAMLFAFAGDQHLKTEAAGIQKTGKLGLITINTTPPSSEGVATMLDGFLNDAERIIQQSQRPITRTRAIGKRALTSLLGR